MTENNSIPTQTKRTSKNLGNGPDHHIEIVNKVEADKYNNAKFYFWILEEDYASIYTSHYELGIHHLYGKDRQIFNEMIKRYPDVKFRLLPPKESAIVFTANDSTLPMIEYRFFQVGAYTNYSRDYGMIFNHKTMKELEELCQRHDSEIDVELRKNTFTLRYYTEILVFGNIAIESDDEITDTGNESTNESNNESGSHNSSSDKSIHSNAKTRKPKKK